MRIALVCLAFAAPCCVAQEVSAPPPTPHETLAQKEYFANNQSYIDRSLEEIRGTCGKDIGFSFDRTTWWAGREEVDRGASPYGRCDTLVQVVRNLCASGEDFRAAVVAGIDSITCAYGGKTSGFSIRLSGGKLDYAVELERANVEEEVGDYLKSQL